MSNSNFLWEIIIKKLKTEVDPEVFSTWIEPNFIDFVDMKKKIVTICSPNLLISEYLQNFFDIKIKEIIKSSTSVEFNLFYNYLEDDKTTIKESKKNHYKNTEDVILENFFSKDKPSGVQNIFSKQHFSDKSYTKPKDALNYNYDKSSLNKKFLFDNFVVGEGNVHAYNLAYSCTVAPGEHNPLFIYGGVGLGKTHLLHAIGNELVDNYPGYKVKCVTSEQFLNDYVNSIQIGNKNKNAAEEFRKKYREVDALLIDDIQFLSGKTGIQTAFFHTFNELYLNQKQIVLISDREPNDLDGLDDRLVSRFDSGVLADITPPDYETRVAIIKYKCKKNNISLDDSIISYISGNISGNIRQIEGILKEIKFKSTSVANITLSMVENIIKHRVKNIKKNITPEDIINVTSDFYKISVDDILSSKRNKEIVNARMIAIYLCRELTNLSLPAIGKLFNKDHSSIFYSNSKISTMILENTNNILNDIENIKEKLKKI